MKADPAATRIPVFDVGPDWVSESLALGAARTHALLDAQPPLARAAAAAGDRVARRWLAKGDPAALDEIDRVAAIMGRPGAYFLNASYDFGCSTVAAPGPGGGALLTRALDWPTRGLGRWASVIRVRGGSAGPWACVGWPGYTGVLQAVAPGRFAAALNQAPASRTTGVAPVDWALGAVATWRRPRISPSRLLRAVFETAQDFGAAADTLEMTPLSSAAIFVVAGADGSTAVIERTPDAVSRPAGPAAAANAWRTPGWRGRPRGEDNAGRLAMIASLSPTLGAPGEWLRPPVLNATTRLAFVADASTGEIATQGFEDGAPATPALHLPAWR